MITLKEGYTPTLGLYETQRAIGRIKRTFAQNLCAALNLVRVSAPLFVDPSTGLNDDLNGVERPVSFDIPALGGEEAQVVHSLAKWKRMALGKYGFHPGEGLYTDMNAIRRDEIPDNLHSVYVDQWDWEKIITREQRTEAALRTTVTAIVGAICDTLEELRQDYPALPPLSREVSFVTTLHLEELYPELPPKAREDAWLREHPTAFIMQIGGLLPSGIPHDGRAPDYDDWTLNGDIVFWNSLLGQAFEVSSMGIRVDAPALDRQLTLAGCDGRRQLPFHRALLENRLPLTMGGGIGQSRLCMLLLRKLHIGEVQSSLWDAETLSACEKAGIPLL